MFYHLAPKNVNFSKMRNLIFNYSYLLSFLRNTFGKKNQFCDVTEGTQ